MKKAILLVVAASTLMSFVAYGRSDETMKNVHISDIPAIDRSKSPSMETATFALG